MAQTLTLDHCISCRLNQDEYDRVREICARQGITTSKYFRAVIRLVLVRGDVNAGAILIDGRTAIALERELVKQGHNINQGVHALNAIAQFFRMGKSDYDWLAQRFDHAVLAFTVVNDHHDDLVRRFEAIDRKTIFG